MGRKKSTQEVKVKSSSIIWSLVKRRNTHNFDLASVAQKVRTPYDACQMLNMQKEKQRLKQLAAELVAMREVFSKAGTCGSSSLMVVTGGTLVM